MRKALARQRLIAGTLLAALLFNAPLLWLVDVEATVLGVPALYAYLFAVWGGFIAFLAWVVERGG
ncbi:hypothetical protein G3580_15475 [Nitrogeniibacter mangrovi]|uniref:Uncharacterized protein n=1 Tax=Nitrogeniibacter mangrovi TaxID=2016596 RepID=A0A6C1B986_9RHOO|nr:hypothetical protein [Nitrogeniibacter mangrovi]QID18900.1 hypothetical protein G3580_15475 [Nitrogeniibacter mangrovi]